MIDASKQGWGIINHDLFLSNAQIRQVIRGAIDGRPPGGACHGSTRRIHPGPRWRPSLQSVGQGATYNTAKADSTASAWWVPTW